MASNYENVQSISRIAGADLSDSQYRFVKVNSLARVVLAGSAERAMGVTIGANTEGKALEIGIAGRLLVVLGATVAAGADVQSDANGAAITQASTGISCGTALEGGVAGDVVSISFDPQGAP